VAISAEQRDEVMTRMSADFAAIGPVRMTKTDLRAAISAVDGFLDSNASTINAAIPQPARAELNATQKRVLVSYVARYGG
jgi:hypothetical protein